MAPSTRGSERPESDEPTARAALLRALGIDLEPALLEQALTHRSFAYEHGGIPDNERLEFLGDSVLGLAVTERLYGDHPDLDEGELAKRRASLVSSVALAEVARGIGLGEHLRLGRGEELTGGRDKSSLLADTVEAIIGATYLDLGGEAATELVLRLVRPLMADADRFGVAMDPKTALQELAARLGRPAPHYAVEGTGPDHARVFTATVLLGDDAVATGSGTSKKAAEVAAALDACALLAPSAE